MVIVNGEATKPRRNKNNNILTTNKQEVKIMYPTRTNSLLPEIFNDFINTEFMPKTNATAPAINVKETKDEYIVELAAPGMKKEDFDININQNGDLNIKMENRHETKEEEKKTHYLRREFSYTKFEQTLILPDDVNKEKIAAHVADGVLTIELPKVVKEEVKVARQITVG
jgi:HSP20 family protein